VDLILLGPTGDRRQLQDSPILGDVWIKYAANPRKQWDLLISPEKTFAAGAVAATIAQAVRKLTSEVDPECKDSANVACLQALIAAKLTFRELLQVVVPMTVWWKERQVQKQLPKSSPRERVRETIAKLQECLHLQEDEDSEAVRHFTRLTALERYVTLAGVILWASEHGNSAQGIAGDLAQLKNPQDVVDELIALRKAIQSVPAIDRKEASVWLVSLNRRAMAALEKSVQAVKGDAARTLFKVKCDEIAWAVLDSGIDGTHPAFWLDDTGKENRIVKAYDFSNIRTIVSLDNLELPDDQLVARLPELKRLNGEQRKAKIRKLKRLAEDASQDRPIYWELVEEFITLDPETRRRPESSHGTHVAGILGGRADPTRKQVPADGMCPDIKLYDFRILSKDWSGTEFAIIAALQFIRHLNERSGFMVIHGANLSLSIPHDVRNYACGSTPICNECERLVANGVVVVAAAGNFGYQSFETKEGRYDSYAAFSITDPGNADGVITVGATHRFWPHTYGVSFFSSRGPTGDGRLKPDLVAPGERIRSALVDQGWGELDGTSMAAPHVSGAAAMLMARYSELIGQPRRIKKTLCESATDLGRERTFQGHGMLDVLRAFQMM
jgi:serine protease AprX